MLTNNLPINKTILFIAPTAYPLGGVAVWLNYILPGLRDAGWDIVFGMLSGRFHDEQRYVKNYPFENTIEIRNPSGTRHGRVLAIQQAISMVVADIVVSINAVDVFEAANKVKKKRNKELKVVMTLHGLEVDYFEDIKSMSAQLDAVVTTNKLTSKMVYQYCQFELDRIHYAPYGVQLNEVNSSKKKISNISSNKPIKVLYVGRVAEVQKRSSDLVKLVQALEQEGIVYELLIAGDGPTRQDVLEQLNSVCHIGWISYLGKLNQQQLFKQAYHKADVLILTSEWETGPIVVWEAMANSVAVVTSRYIGCRVENALVDEKNCLMFDIGDMQQATEHIILLRKQKVREKLVQAGLKLVTERYSRQTSIAQWGIVMRSILSDYLPKKATLLNSYWNKNGYLEKCFGHVLAHKIRRIFKKPAMINDAGDEWPHSYTRVNQKMDNGFTELVKNVENEN